MFDHLTESTDESTSCFDVAVICSSEREFEHEVTISLRFNEYELNDQIKDLNLSKETSKVLASKLNEKNLPQPGTNRTFNCRREKRVTILFFQGKQSVFRCSIGDFYKHQTSRMQFTRTASFIDSPRR